MVIDGCGVSGESCLIRLLFFDVCLLFIILNFWVLNMWVII